MSVTPPGGSASAVGVASRLDLGLAPPGTRGRKPSTVRFTYTEPAQNADNTALTDLTATRVYARPVDGSTAAWMVFEEPASALTGGGAVSRAVAMPPGHWELYATAIDDETPPNESVFSNLDTLVVP